MRDDVAQNIRNQQNADAAPSPSEVRERHRERLANDGCLVCQEDDPDRLMLKRVPRSFCSNDQHPRKPFDTVVFCDEHQRPSKTLKRAKMVQDARNRDADVLAIYKCGATLTASWDVPDADALARKDPWLADREFSDLRLQTKLRIADPPRVPTFHAGRGCGAELTDVIHLNDP